MSIERIVCPVDYSDCSKRALRYAGLLAGHLGAGLDVLHVVDPLLVAATAVHQVDVLGEDARTELNQFAAAELPAAVPVTLTVVKGTPHREIVRFAARQHAGLVVMGTHGLHGVRKVLFGSTTRHVLRNTRIPVLAVPLPDTATRADLDRPLIASGPVVVPLDFSPASIEAAGAAVPIASALGVPVVLLHVLEPRHFGGPARRLHGMSNADPEANLREVAARINAPMAHIAVAAGHPAEQIAAQARDRGATLVVSAQSNTGLQAGSVTYQVLCDTLVPVLLVPRTVRRERAAGAALSTVICG